MGVRKKACILLSGPDDFGRFEHPTLTLVPAVYHVGLVALHPKPLLFMPSKAESLFGQVARSFKLKD